MDVAGSGPSIDAGSHSHRADGGRCVHIARHGGQDDQGEQEQVSLLFQRTVPGLYAGSFGPRAEL